jgi:hypothetical protein
MSDNKSNSEKANTDNNGPTLNEVFQKDTGYAWEDLFQKRDEKAILTWEDTIGAIFNKTTLTYIIWFLAIYIIAIFVFGIFFKKGADTSTFETRLGKSIDIIFLFILIIFIVTSLINNSETNRQHIIQDAYNKLTTYVNQPTSILTTGFILIAIYGITYLFRVPMSRESKPVTVSIVETVTWLIFVFILFIDFFKYVLKQSLTDILANLFNVETKPSYAGNVKVSATVNVAPVITGNIKAVSLSTPVQQNEVFNISNNLYTYDDAQAICTSYGATIATYDQIEDAYKNGGEWCNYGWSDGQMAFFPTQKSTWNKLQQTDNHKNDCGRPGINGGYMANPYIKFGVNCYGKKPQPTEDELAALKAKTDQVYPKNAKDVQLDAKVQFWKDNADKLLNINSFNTKEWSEY